MTSHYYAPSGRVGPLALPIAILSVAVLPPAAYAYAWLTLQMSSVCNMFISIGFSFLIGWVVESVAVLGKVRNARWIGQAGCGLALAAWYFQWAAWTTLAFDHRAVHPLSSPVIEHFLFMMTHPAAIISAAIAASAVHVIEDDSMTIRGGWLAAVWLVEFGVHLVVPPVRGQMRIGEPFCERSNSWAKKIKCRARFPFVWAASSISNLLELHPQQVTVIFGLPSSDTRNYSEVYVYRVKSERSYISIINHTITTSGGATPVNESKIVLEFLAVPDMGADELLSLLTKPDPYRFASVVGMAMPARPELASALADLAAGRYEAVIEAASRHGSATQKGLRADANRLCAQASARLGRWADAVDYWQQVGAKARTKDDDLQMHTGSVMAHNNPSGVFASSS